MEATKHRNLYRAQDQNAMVIRGMEAKPETFISLQHYFMRSSNPRLFEGFYCGSLSNLHPFERDRVGLDWIYNNLIPDKVLCFHKMTLTEYMTGQAPLVDFLTSDFIQSHGGFSFSGLDVMWSIRANRSIVGVQHHDFHKVLITDQDSDAVQKASEFFYSHFNADQARSPTGVVGREVQFLNLQSKDCDVPLRPTSSSAGVVMADVVMEGEDTIAVPARILVGGRDWTLSVKYDVEFTKGRKGHGLNAFYFNNPVIPQMVEFLQWLPTLCGFGLTTMRKTVEKYMSKLGVPDFEFMNSAVDIETLAALAWFHSQDVSWFNVNFQLTGGILFDAH